MKIINVPPPREATPEEFRELARLWAKVIKRMLDEDEARKEAR